MLKRAVKAVVTLVLIAVLALSAVYFAFPKIGYEKKGKSAVRFGLLELRDVFRSSLAVIEATCLDSYISSTGSYFSNYRVDKVLAGNSVKEGSVISVMGRDEKNSLRIIYLNRAIDDVHSENETVYTFTEGGKLAFDGSSISVSEEVTLPIELLENDIASLKKETLVPLKYYYYEDANELIKRCSSIFIGRIESVKKEENADLLTNNRGEVIKNEGAYTELSVRVLDGLVWQHNYGDRLDIRIVQGSKNSIINVNTNEHFYSNASYSDFCVGDICVFFVNKSPDEKAEHFFLVNDYQGIIEIIGERVSVHPDNWAFAGLTELDALIEELLAASGYPFNKK